VLAAQALAQGVLAHVAGELRDDVAVEREVRVDAQLERVEPRVLELARSARRPRLGLEVGQRPPAEERERLAQRFGGLLRRLITRALDKGGEAIGVQLPGLERDDVACGPRLDQRVRRQRPPQPRDVRLQRRRRVAGRVLAPQRLDDAVAGEHLARVQDEQRQHRALPQASERDRVPVHHHLEGPEHPDLHAATLSAPPCGG
jgi:hypothetical protein